MTCIRRTQASDTTLSGYKPFNGAVKRWIWGLFAGWSCVTDQTHVLNVKLEVLRVTEGSLQRLDSEVLTALVGEPNQELDDLVGGELWNCNTQRPETDSAWCIKKWAIKYAPGATPTFSCCEDNRCVGIGVRGQRFVFAVVGLFVAATFLQRNTASSFSRTQPGLAKSLPKT